MVRVPRLSLKHRVERFWEEDRGLSILLGVILVSSFVVAPIAESWSGGGTLLRAFVSLMFASGAYVLATRRASRLGIVLVTGLPLVLGWLEHFRPGRTWTGLAAASSCAFALILAGFVVKRVFKEGPITVHRVVGSIVVYLLIGIAFGEGARIVGTIDPAAYASGSFDDIDRAELYYFSFVTLTTVGYGDITPVAPAARSLAILEALTGQLFPAILIARLVSQELMSRDPRR